MADRLAAQGHQVIGCDTLTHGGRRENIGERIEFHRADARDHHQMVRLLKGVDTVFHAAALGHDGFSVFSPHLIAENIFSSTTSLLSAAANNGVRRFVYCSSMARYGNQLGPFTEDMLPRPVTPYGVAKVASEEMVRNVSEMHGMEWAVCVPHNIIGPRQKYDDPYRNVAAIMINRMLQNLPPIIFGDGEQKRCFSSVWDILNVLDGILFSPQAVGQIVNVGPDEEFVSVNELCIRLSRILGKDINPVYLPARPKEVLEATCSADKARRLFGYETRHSLDSILSEIAQWILEEGPKPFSHHLSLELLTNRTPEPWVPG